MSSDAETEMRGEYLERVREAVERHFSRTESIAPGYAAIEIDEDISIEVRRATLHAGVYFMKADEVARHKVDARERVTLYACNPYIEATTKDVDGILESANKRSGIAIAANDAGAVEIKMDMLPLTTSEGHGPVTFDEAAAWAAISDARSSGDENLARRLFREAYNLPDKPITEDLAPEPDVPRQDAKRLPTHTQPIDRLYRQISNIETTGEEVAVRMSGENDSPTIKTYISLSYEGADASLSKPISTYDKLVHNAVASLWAAGVTVVTSGQVYIAMTGSRSYPSKKAISEVEQSLDKQRFIAVTLDYSEEFRDRPLPRPEKRAYYMLNADKTWIRNQRGELVNGYVINQEPVLYMHARETRQLISYPQSLLEATAAEVNSTNRSLVIRDYLLERIKTMSRPGSKLSKNIRYESLYEAAGSEAANRKQTKQMRDTAKRILDILRAEKFIAGWSEYEDGGSSHKKLGVTIKVKSEPRKADR